MEPYGEKGGDDGDDGDEEHVCEACGEAFETEAALKRHVHDVGLVH